MGACMLLTGQTEKIRQQFPASGNILLHPLEGKTPFRAEPSPRGTDRERDSGGRFVKSGSDMEMVR